MNLWDIVKSLVDLASPQVREAFCKFLEDLMEKANQTPNPFDNILVYTLQKLAGCK